MREKLNEIAGIKVHDKMKYLGITINDKRNIFKIQRELIIEKATKTANLTYLVAARSCAKLMIGEAYWTSIVLPMILYGTNIIDFTKEEIQKLQRIENSVGRKILCALSSAQEVALRGEIGISSMKSRIMEGQLKYLQHILRGESNRLVERVIKEMRAKKKKNRCITSLLEVRKLVGIRGMNIETEEISEKKKNGKLKSGKMICKKNQV